MKKFVKSMLAVGVTTALNFSTAYAASYDVIPKLETTTHKYSYAQQENNNGQMVLSGTSVFNFPVQYQYFTDEDFDDIAFYAARNNGQVTDLVDIQDFEALKAGNPTGNDLYWVIRWLRDAQIGKGGSSLYQKVGDTSAMVNFGNGSEEVLVFDQPLNDAPLSRSTVDVVKGITDTGWIYGNASAPYLPFDFTDSNGDAVVHWAREFSNRAFFSPDGGNTVVPILPPEIRYGGESGILDIADVDAQNHIAVGFMSTDMNPDVLERILSETDNSGCANPDYIDDVPAEICIQTLRDSSSFKAYEVRAFKSELTANSEPVTTELPLLVTPHVDDTRSYAGYAQAVNIHGVAVGFSHGWVDETETNPASNETRDLYAVVYKNGKAYSLIEDHNPHRNSRAYDINNNGIAVGHLSLAVNSSLRTKYYYIDTTNTDTMEMVLPTDFFTGSSSTARAINDSGIIVGEGEFETHNDTNGSNPRRTHAFMYDINNDVFTDLNDVTPCGTPYSIIEARDINEDNVISATAVITVDRRDAYGELVLDDSGTPLKEDIVMAVTLQPKPGGDDGQICTAEEDKKVIRQGAGLGLWSLLGLALLGFRRKFLAK